MDVISRSNESFPSQITDRIFIGDHRAASNINTYNAQYIGITHVINCAASEFLKQYPSNVSVLSIRASDEVKYKIIDKHIEDVTQFVNNALSKSEDSKVLFHCLAGVNRSVTLCIAYLIHQQRDSQSMEDIIDLVSKKRQIGILSNMGFVKQLVQYNTKVNAL